ncbi:MAG: hypothetical protein ABFR75_06080 [Acidobacteriota bacterium]
MKKIIIGFIFIIFAIAISTSPLQGERLKTSLVPADAQWVININVSKFLKTNIWNTIFNTEVKDGEFFEKSAEIKRKLNFDILKDLSGITIYGKKKRSKDAVVLLQGNFDKEKILDTIKYEKGKLIKEKYGKHLIYKWNSDDYGVFINKNLALISHNKDAVRSALEVISGKVKNIRHGSLYKEIRSVKGDPVFYLVAGDISEFTKGHKTPFLINQAKNILITASEGANSLNFMMKLDTANEEAAKNIQQVANGLIALARMNKSKVDKDLKFLETLDILVKGSRLMAKISLPSEMISEKISEKNRYKKGKKHFKKKRVK